MQFVLQDLQIHLDNQHLLKSLDQTSGIVEPIYFRGSHHHTPWTSAMMLFIQLQDSNPKKTL